MWRVDENKLRNFVITLLYKCSDLIPFLFLIQPDDMLSLQYH